MIKSFVCVVSVFFILSSAASAHSSQNLHKEELSHAWSKLLPTPSQGGVSNMRLVHVYIPGVGHLGSSRHCDGADDLNGISDNLWSGVSRIVGITSGAVVYVKTEPWDQDDIINGTTACYAVTGEIRLGKSHLNDQIKKAHIKCGSVTVSKVSATLLEHDVTSDSSQGDGEKKTLLRVCGH